MARKAQGKLQKSKNLRQRLQDSVNALLDAIAKFVAWAVLPVWEWLGVRWERLSPNGQKAFFVCLWLAGVAFGVYSAWFARLHNATAPVIRWGWLRVEARYGFLLLLVLVSMPTIIFVDRFNEKRKKTIPPRLQTSALLRRWQERVIPPLALARWLYLRHQATPALARTQALLAQEPDNAAARELLALIEKQIAERPADAPDAPDTQPTPPRPGRADRLADSNLVGYAPRLIVAAMLCLCLYGSVSYARVGIRRGWQTTVWTGHDKSGNLTQSSALSTMIECLLGVGVCGLYLVYEEGLFANAAVWKKVKAKRSAKRNGQATQPVERQS